MKHPIYRAAAGAALTIWLTGCAPQLAYQVFETRPEVVRAPTQTAAPLAFAYDFWNPDGQATATLTNTSAAPLYLDWQRAHLIVNGQSREYYADTEYENSQSAGQSAAARRTFYNPFGGGYSAGAVGASVASGSAMRVRNRPLIEIPPGASISVRPMTVAGGPLTTCDLDRYDTRKSAVVSFDSATTPLRFRFYFTYSRHPDLHDPQVLDAGFRVERITAMMSREFAGPRRANVDPCSGRKLLTTTNAYPFAKKRNLYVEFNTITGY